MNHPECQRDDISESVVWTLDRQSGAYRAFPPRRTVATSRKQGVKRGMGDWLRDRGRVARIALSLGMILAFACIAAFAAPTLGSASAWVSMVAGMPIGALAFHYSVGLIFEGKVRP